MISSGLPASLARDRLQDNVLETLSRGGWGNPDVVLVRTDDGPVVVKDFAPRPAWIRCTVGRWITRREVAAYRALEGLPAIPRLLGVVDGLAFAIEHRPGEILSRGLAERIPREFLAELREAVETIHGRGVVHLDLRHRSNVLAGRDGHPVLLDFASALRARPSGWLPGWTLAWGRWIDRRALRKWEARLGR